MKCRKLLKKNKITITSILILDRSPVIWFLFNASRRDCTMFIHLASEIALELVQEPLAGTFLETSSISGRDLGDIVYISINFSP
jgi:hypothetical protein